MGLRGLPERGQRHLHLAGIAAARVAGLDRVRAQRERAQVEAAVGAGGDASRLSTATLTPAAGLPFDRFTVPTIKP